MSNTAITQYQEQGFEFGAQKALNLANEHLSSARKATPQEFRDMFIGRIRYIQSAGGYSWEWVIR